MKLVKKTVKQGNEEVVVFVPEPIDTLEPEDYDTYEDSLIVNGLKRDTGRGFFLED